MADLLRWLGSFNGSPPAATEAIRDAEAQLGVSLPSEYTLFLETMNGGEGFLGDNYLILWSVDELARCNAEMEVSRYAPGLLLFGTDGGGETFGFDSRSPDFRIVMMPAIGMEWGVEDQIASSFGGFLERLTRLPLELI